MWTMDRLMRIRLSHNGRHVEFNDEVWHLPTPEEVLEWFMLLEAGWVYPNNPAHAHAILHSGKHSNGFFLCKKVLAYGGLREILAACMIQKLRKAGLGKVDGVFGSPQSSILLSGDIGRLLGVKTYVLEKDSSDPTGKKMIFKGDDPAPAGSVLLQIEELVTTWSSGGSSADAFVAGNPFQVTFAPQVGVLVHRPPKIERKLTDGRILVPFIERQVDAWDPADCPLCKAGSVAITPKGKNWATLVA
jgi:orotate phosphoribosyltransferase